MNRLLIVVLILVLMMGFFIGIELGESNNRISESMMALGFVLIFAYLIGKMVTRFQLPKITGYILAGIISGPYFLNLVPKPVVQDLQLIDEIALSLIAITAGGEFRYQAIRKQFKAIGSAIFWQIAIVIISFVIFIYLYQGQISFLNYQGTTMVLGVGLLFGALCIATSPATTIAFITETGAMGKFTDFVLGVTVFKDIIAVLIFSIALSVSKPLILPEAEFHANYIGQVVLEIVISIALGMGAGALILLYLKYVGRQTALFLLGFVLLGIELSAMMHIEVILLFMVAGFFVQNFSDSGSKLIEAIEAGSLPIFVIFFAIAGTSLNFPVFFENWILALLIVFLRLVTTFEGTYLGGKLTGADSDINHYGWMGFVGQAGLTLGFAALVKKNLPGEIGNSIATLIIASIAINQIVGPVLFRYSLVKVGETRWSA